MCWTVPAGLLNSSACTALRVHTYSWLLLLLHVLCCAVLLQGCGWITTSCCTRTSHTSCQYPISL